MVMSVTAIARRFLCLLAIGIEADLFEE